MQRFLESTRSIPSRHSVAPFREEVRLRLHWGGTICYNTSSNSVLVTGLETANFEFVSTIRLCAATKHRGALLRSAFEWALSGASIPSEQKGCAAFISRAGRRAQQQERVEGGTNDDHDELYDEASPCNTVHYSVLLRQCRRQYFYRR